MSYLTNPYMFAEPLVPFVDFVAKWVSGGTGTFVIGLSRLSYFPSAVDELGLEYGFLFRPNHNDYFQTIKDGSIMTDVDTSIDTDTEFKLTYDGTTMRWYGKGEIRDTEVVSLSGTYYLWTNCTQYGVDETIQCQYGGVDATWTGYDGDGASWQISNPQVTKDGGSGWGTGVYALAQTSTY